MKSLLCLIIAAGLHYAEGKFFQKWRDDFDAAIHAPLEIGQVRNGKSVNDSLEDPREVAKTPKAKAEIAETRKYLTAFKLCHYGKYGFIVLAIAIPVIRFLPKEPTCDSSSRSSP